MNSLRESILLVGIHTRPAVFSAKSLGFYTISVDYFSDIDLKERADVLRSITKQQPYWSTGRIADNYSSDTLEELSRDIAADYVILTSGSNIERKVLGNRPRHMAKLKDKIYQLKKAKGMGVTIPHFDVVDSFEDALELGESLGFPCLYKPARGAGGRNVVLAKSKDDVPVVGERYIVQEYVEGVPISVSTLSSRKQSVPLSTSEQILGNKLAGAENFLYCGNIVPYNGGSKKDLEEIGEISAKLSRAFGVVGWNGIDFVDTGEAVFIELNPRFQGTFDCVERSYKINLLDAHMRACEGELIEPPEPESTTMRLTLYAKERCIVEEDLRGLTYDVPLPYSIIEKGEPVTTLIVQGPRSGIKRRCEILAEKIYGSSLSPYLHVG